MSKEIDKEIEDFLAEENSSVDSEINDFLREENPTFEQKYLEPIYNVAGPIVKGLSVLGKPLSVAGATGRSIGKAIVGQEDPLSPLIAEYEAGIYPSLEGNPLAGLESIEGMGDPLLSIPQGIKEQAPKLSSFAEQSSTPAAIAQMAFDIGTEVPFVARAANKAANLSEKAADIYRKATTEAYLNATQKDSSLAGALKSSGKRKDVVDFATANKKNVITPFNKEKAMDFLEGPYSFETDEYGIGRTSRDTSKGYIGSLSEKANQFLSKVKGDKLIDPVDMRASAKGSLDRRMLQNQQSSAEKIINEAIPVLDFKQSEIDRLADIDKFTAENRMLGSQVNSSLVDEYKNMIQERGMLPAGFATELRQQANKLIDGAKLSAVNNPVEAGSMHEAGMALHRAASKAEMEILPQYLSPDEINSFMQLKRQQELGLSTKDLLDKTRLTKGSAGAYVPVGSLDRGILREALSAFPEYVGPVTSSAVDAANKFLVNPTMKAAPYLAPIGSAPQTENNRQPQSIITADTVAQYEIPRDTARIMGEQDMVMAKLQMEVKDPQILGMASQLFSGLQRNPESVKPMVSQLANMFPQIFEKDKYNRFDGKVDPAIVPIAIEDIRKSQMPTIEKASKIESLYNTGLLVD
jgi:hypothetical protein